MTQPVALPPPTSEETTMALLAEILQIFTWWIGPLVIYLAKRDSKFISFHAMQALLWQCAMMIFGMIGFGLWMIIVFLSVFPHMSKAAANNSPPPPVFFAFFGLFWLVFMGFWVLNVVIGIVYGVKAGRGEWAPYPLLGRLARRIVEN